MAFPAEVAGLKAREEEERGAGALGGVTGAAAGGAPKGKGKGKGKHSEGEGEEGGEGEAAEGGGVKLPHLDMGDDEGEAGTAMGTGKSTKVQSSVVQCPWCEHAMSTWCCQGWTTVVYLHQRHH